MNTKVEKYCYEGFADYTKDEIAAGEAAFNRIHFFRTSFGSDIPFSLYRKLAPLRTSYVIGTAAYNFSWHAGGEHRYMVEKFESSVDDRQFFMCFWIPSHILDLKKEIFFISRKAFNEIKEYENSEPQPDCDDLYNKIAEIAGKERHVYLMKTDVNYRTDHWCQNS